MKTFAIILVFLFASVLCFGQNVDAIYKNALTEFDNKNYSKSLELFLSIENQVKIDYGENSLVFAYLQLYIGLCYVNLEQRDKAISVLQSAYNIMKQFPEVDKILLNNLEKILSSQTKEIVPGSWEDLNSKAIKYINEGNYILALEYAEKALKQAEKEFGKMHNNYATALNNVAFVYQAQGQLSKAEPYYLEAFDMCKKLYPKEKYPEGHPDLASSLNNLGYLYQAQGQLSKAEQYYLEALEMNKKLYPKEQYPEGHPDLANSLNNLGYLYQAQGQLSKAEQYYLKALEMRKKLYPKEKYPEGHPDLAKSLNNLGALYDAQGQLSKAEPYFLEALEMRKKLYPKEKYPEGHPYLATSLNNLGGLYRAQGQLSKAEPYYLEALEMNKKLYPKEQYPEGHPDLANSLNNLGYLYQAQGQLSKAEPYYLEALEMYKKLYPKERYPEGHPDLAISLNYLGLLYQAQGQLSKAEPYYLEALEMRKKLYPKERYPEGHPDLALSLNNLGYLYNAQGQLSKAEPYFLEALEMYKKLYPKEKYPEGHPDLAWSLNNLGALYNSQGQLSKAEQYYLEALEIFKKLYPKEKYPEGHPYLARSLNNLGALYDSQGQLSKAEQYYLDALEIFKKLYPKEKYPEGHPDLALSLNNLGYLYNAQGQLSKAEPYFLEALEMYKKLYPKERYPEGHPDLAMSLNNLGYLYQAQGQLSKAEPYYLEALEMYKKLYPKERYPEGHPYLATSLNNLGYLYNAQGQLSKAEPYFLEALEMYKKLYPKERYPEGHPYLATSLNNLGLLYKAQDKLDEAEKLLNEGLNILKRLFISNSVSMSENEKEQYWKTSNYNFERYHSFTEKRIKENKQISALAYNNLLFTKGLLLNSTMKVKNNIMNSNDEQLKSQYKKWQSLKEYLAKLYRLDIYELEKANINRDSIEELANTLEKELSSKSAQFADEFDKKLIEWKDVQSKLQEGEAAIEIVRITYFDNRWTDTVHYVAYIIKKNSQYPEMVLFENGNYLDSIAYFTYQYSIGLIIDDQLKINNSLYNLEPDSLYYYYWEPIANCLKGINKVYLSNDGVYNNINLNTIKNPETGKYLLNTIDIVYVTSTRDLVKKQRIQDDKALTASLFGYPKYDIDQQKQELIASKYNRSVETSNYLLDEDMITRGAINELPGTKLEVEQIDTILTNHKWKTTKYLSEEALEEAVKAQQSPKILHIATHGYFYSDIEIIENYKKGKMSIMGTDIYKSYENPLLRSGLLLTGAENTLKGQRTRGSKTEDGLLTAYETMNLNLDNTELVVLSACETGLGKIKNGEGVYGLQRAFKVAGAETILMSLWKVSDKATQELMSIFYTEWLKGSTKREAFKLAQEKIKEKYASPYFWGAFVMVGE